MVVDDNFDWAMQIALWSSFFIIGTDQKQSDLKGIVVNKTRNHSKIKSFC